jgi:S-adenosylmethionine uptake transporter
MTSETMRRTTAPVLVACLGVASFALMDAVMKDLTLTYGAVGAVFWRTVPAVIVAAVVFVVLRTPWPSRAAWRMHALRGGIATITATLFFVGLARMPLADAIALSFVAPIIMVLLGGLLLKETIRPSAIFACGLGSLGVFAILYGQLTGIVGREAWIGAGALLISAVTYGLQQVLLRRQAQSEPQAAVVLFPPAIATLILAVPVAFAPRVPVAADWPMVLLAAGLTLASLYLMSWAYKRAEAQQLAPLEYTAFIWGVLLGYVMFQEKLTLSTLVGTVMIIAACFVALRR